MEKVLLDHSKSRAAIMSGSPHARYNAFLDRVRRMAPRIDRPEDRPLLRIDHLGELFHEDRHLWIRRVLGVTAPALTSPGKVPGCRVVQFKFHLCVPVAALRAWLVQHGTPEQVAHLDANAQYSERFFAVAERKRAEGFAKSRKAQPKAKNAEKWKNTARPRKDSPARPVPNSVFDLGACL